MTAISSWLAGMFDANGKIYPTPSGLAVRVTFPKRSLANQVRMALGGKVGGIGKKSWWQISSTTDLDRFLDSVVPFVRHQGEAVEILQAWMDKDVTLFEAGNQLSDFYSEES